jgi:hypothetical protein
MPPPPPEENCKRLGFQNVFARMILETCLQTKKEGGEIAIGVGANDNINTG